MLPALRNAEYNGLIAAPGTPKAVVMPSFFHHRNCGINRSHLRHGCLQEGE
ncbi:BIR protein, partial [Corchorus olitorius]